MNHSYHLKTRNILAADLMLCINVILFNMFSSAYIRGLVQSSYQSLNRIITLLMVYSYMYHCLWFLFQVYIDGNHWLEPDHVRKHMLQTIEHFLGGCFEGKSMKYEQKKQNVNQNKQEPIDG